MSKTDCFVGSALQYGWSRTVVYQGGYGTGWVIRVGIPGEYPASLHRRAHPGMYSEAGPGSPRGTGVGGTYRAGWAGPAPTLRARSCPCRALPGAGPLHAASGPITARFDLISLTVSQNGGVSPKICQKACHSPCFTFEAQKSPLDFLRFPFRLAFSPKELMVPF